MTLPNRPDLGQAAPEVRLYIEALEAELERLRLQASARPGRLRSAERSSAAEATEADEALLPPLEPTEPPTSLQVITLSAIGSAKRTPRHLYPRQRRGGWGALDLETSESDLPAALAVAEESRSLIVLTSLARAFRVPVRVIAEAGTHAPGRSIFERTPLQPEEVVVAALPDQAKGSIAMVSQRGMVRSLRHHVFGEYMKPGTVMFETRSSGPLAAACWTPGNGDLFIATRLGRAIRFSEKLVPPTGGPGIRMDEDDAAVAIAAVYPESGVFLISADGRGTIRHMAGFNPNKSTGGSGKLALTSDALAAAAAATEKDDLFLLSRGGKLIRFMAAEVPSKEGVVQGVNCMALRADEVVAAAVSPTKAG